MTITGRRRDRTQSGFTLIETLIGMTIVGVIIAVLANALIIGLKTTDKTTDSLIQSHDQQVVSAHLVTDLQNVRHDGVG
ncbi:MAG TPA: prepilin-type N-terminal cleavage/methylation domain-containing protein, partial [Acidimicrobiales bacterium]|nr:prepilin-type N-terminal cleavage/methylation domain-containing protein [Acidimicrobiales bacterium]